jgi:ABC-2 type transport system permease protein
MKKMRAILKRELFSYLASPMGYIILAAYTFTVAWGFFHFLNIIMYQLHNNPAGIYAVHMNIIPNTFSVMMIVLLLITPALTMKSIAEEKSKGTIQLLLTAPVRDIDVIGGKFLAAFIFFVIIIGATIVFPLIIYFSTVSPEGVSAFNWGKVLSGYTGLILLSGLFCAIGIFISSLVESQVVAAVITLVFLIFGNWILGLSGRYFPSRIGEVVSYFSFQNHFMPFLHGVVSTEHIIFFVSTILLLIFFSIKSLEKRKWSNLLEDDTSRQLFKFDPFWTGALFLWGLFILLFFIIPTYDILSMIIFAFGCVLALIWVIIKRKQLAFLFKSRKGMAGANVIITTVIVCVIYGVISLANHQYNKMWDVTFSKIQSLSPATKKLIDSMKTETDFYVFMGRQNAHSILEWYDQYSKKITVHYLDPVHYRSDVERITREVGQSGLENYIVIKNKESTFKRARLVKMNVPIRLLEEEIDLKLISITHEAEKKKKKKVYFLTGHGESRINNTSKNGLSQLAFLLEKEYIEYEELFLPAAKKVPGDCDLLVISGPGHRESEEGGITHSYFAPEEIRILREYLQQRRNLLVFAGPEFSRVTFTEMRSGISQVEEGQGMNPAYFVNKGGLAGLLAEAGFFITNGIVLCP